MRFPRQFRARIAWLKSFFKRNWSFEDYPVDYVDQGMYSLFSAPRFEHHRWRVDLLGSHVCGLGDDQSQALADARFKFEQFLQAGGEPRRPGSPMNVEFASADTVDLFPDLQKHFINTVLELPWALVSDLSSLSDFHHDADDSRLLERIWQAYGVDVSYIKDGNLGQILKSIMDEIHEFPEDDSVRAVRLGRDARDRRVAGLPVPRWIQAEDDEEDRLNGIT